jgi:uncharacterized protein YkwD
MRKLAIIATILLIIAGETGCEAQDADNLMTSRDKREMVRLVNEAREKGVYCGDKWHKPVEPLKWDETLEQAAVIKSLDMYGKNYFSHSSPGGETLTDRLKKVKYSWRAMGENLAKGPTSVEQTVGTWLKSEGHCRNIMKPEFTHFGAAQYGTYWTQVFGTPAEK